MGGLLLAFALLAIATNTVINAQAAKIKELEAEQLILRTQVEFYMRDQEVVNNQHGQAISGLLLKVNEEERLEKSLRNMLRTKP